MTETIEVDTNLLDYAGKLVGVTDKKKIVEQALNEMIRRRAKVAALLDMAGTIEFYEGYNYKKLRASRHDNP